MTLEELIDKIAKCCHAYQATYDVTPFDLCLGPEEFNLLSEGFATYATVIEKQLITKMPSQMFYRGMRIRLLSSPGVLVGTLTNKIA